jgi:hypothetical protein
LPCLDFVVESASRGHGSHGSGAPRRVAAPRRVDAGSGASDRFHDVLLRVSQRGLELVDRGLDPLRDVVAGSSVRAVGTDTALGPA